MRRFCRLLAPFLGLDKRDEEEVGRERSLGEQRVKMMEVWRHKFGGDATYLRFVRGCEEAQRRDLVGAVYSLVQQPASKEEEEGEGEGQGLS